LTLIAVPLAVPQLLWDYRLQGISPAVNAGINRNSLFPKLLFDFDFTARPKGSSVDIGAHEKQ